MIRYVFADRPVIINNLDDANPQKIGEALQKIADANQGHIKAEAVVEAAKNKRHVLHPHFEWNDEKAANAYRLSQARHIIRSISVEDGDEGEEKPAFISISEKGGRSYRSLGEVESSTRLQKLVLQAAKRDLQAFKDRYRKLSDLFEPGVTSAIDRLDKEADDQPGV